LIERIHTPNTQANYRPFEPPCLALATVYKAAFPALTGYASAMLYLASQSPRRRELLQQIGVEHGLIEVNVPEQRLPLEIAEDYVSRVAREKAGAGLLKVMANPSALVLGADTEVVLDDRVYGKPGSREEAASMLRSLANREHQVISAVWLISAGQEQHAINRSAVRFSSISDEDLQYYLDSNEWQGKAGAYAIQGKAAKFIAYLEGSYSGVMGLPLFETSQLLKKFGVVA
jgi:septum formation protein